jgi:hypothetical protein
MQHHLVRQEGFSGANVAHDILHQIAAFHVINLPAKDFSAKNTHEQIQVKIDALHPCQQIGDVPAKQLVGCGGTERTRLVSLLRRAFGTAMADLIHSS